MEAAGSGPRVSGDVSSVSRSCLIPAAKPGEGRFAAPLALAGPPSPHIIDWASPL